MVSDAQNLAALGSAAQLVAINLGLDGTPASAWSQDDRLGYIQALAHTILQYPQNFSAATLQSASVILGQNFNGMTLDDFINAAPDGGASTAKVFVDQVWDSTFSLAGDAAAVGAGAAKLVGNLGRSAGNLGDTVERATATGSNSSLITIAVIGFVALLVLNAEKKLERTIS